MDINPISKSRASKCVTHHHGCDCREYNFKQMHDALKVIHVWATSEVFHKGDAQIEILKAIANTAAKALNSKITGEVKL